MAEMTIGGKTTTYGQMFPTGNASVPRITPQQELVNTETDRLKKFYQGQYEVEASRFSKQKMTDAEFKDITDKLQSKYKLAFNEARFQMESRQQTQEPTALKQFSDLDIYKNRIDTDLRQFRVIPAGKVPSWWRPQWFEKTAPEEAEIFDPTASSYDDKSKTWKRGAWRTAKPEEVQLFGTLKSESERVQTLQGALIGKSTSSLMKTAATSKRMGGSIAEQTKNYLQQKETGTQRQEPEDFSKMSDEELKRISEGR